VRRRDFVPLALLGGIAAFIVVQGKQMGRDRATRRAATPEHVAPTTVEPQGGSDPTKTVAGGSVESVRTLDVQPPVELRPSGEPAPPRDDAAIRETIRDNQRGTYLPAILQQQDQLLLRWPERQREALRVWIERDVTIPDWRPDYPVVAERAFDEWKAAGFPLRFDVVTDRPSSDIQIRWTEKFPPSDGMRIGLTSKSRDQNGWLVSAEITIATHDRNGGVLAPELIAGVARHEVGHALGLGHSTDTLDVMFPKSTTPVISAADRATLHLLYMLPPGVVK
jgi:hypothetical protein